MASKSLAPEVRAVIDAIPEAKRRADCLKIIDMMGRHTGRPAQMFGGGMIGFGRVRYKYPTGTSGETFITGFAPRKSRLTLYVLWYTPEDDPLLARLGKHKRGKGCLYIKTLADIDESILDRIIERSATELDGRHIVAYLED